MALKHRVVQRFDRKQRSVEAVQELLRTTFNEWLSTNTARVPADLDGGLRSIGGNFSASFQRVEAGSEGDALRWRFVTGTAPHIYRSTVSVLLASGIDEPSWLWYDVETDRETSHFHPPRLTALLTRALDAGPRDRISGFTEGLRFVRSEEVGDFLDEVLNDERRLVPAFVSGGRNWSHNDEEGVERALAPLYGIGTFWQLAPDAFDEFNSLVKQGYAVRPGSIHSFQFGLDTEDEQDSRRHWWFSPAEVRQSRPKDLSQRLHGEAMQSGLHVPLPAQLLGLNVLFDKMETRRLFGQFRVAHASGIVDAPVSTTARPLPKPPMTRFRPAAESNAAGTPEPVENRETVAELVAETAEAPAAAPGIKKNLEYEAELGVLAKSLADELDLSLPESGGLLQSFKMLFVGVRDRLVGLNASSVDEASIAEIQGEFEELQRDRAELQSEVGVLNELLSHADQEAEMQSDILESQRDVAAAAQRRADHLAAQLSKLQQLQGAEVEWDVPDEGTASADPARLAPPTSVDDLLEQLAQLEHVAFTGDVKIVSKITDMKLRGIILRDVWRFSCELERYARLCEKGEAVSSLRDYIEHHTTQVTQKEFAADETATLKENPKYSRPRELPVPTNVDPSGRVFMGAHFRLSQDNGKAMRMHVYDAVQKDGNLYIGYIGQHLPSRHTN